jgi:hypothetical protein
MTSYSPKTEADRLLALSEKVGRVAESLAELALERDSLGCTVPRSDSGLSPETLDWVIRARRERARYLPAELLGEPSWDMMIHLLYAEVSNQPALVSSACLATGLPEEVGRRWLQAMVENGLVNIRSPHKGEEQVALTAQASKSLRRYFRDILGTQ